MAIYHLDHKVTGNFVQTNKPLVLDDTLPSVPKTIMQIALCHKHGINVTPAMLKKHMPEGMHAIRSGLRGYLHIWQGHYNGRYTAATYDFYESPSLNPHYNPAALDQCTAEADAPDTDDPYAVSAHAVNQHDNNIDMTNNISVDNINNTYLSANNINQSIYPHIIDTNIDGVVRAIRKQIDYDILCTTCPRRLLDDLVATMADVMVQRSSTIHVTRDKSYPTAYVQRLFAKLNALHIEMVCHNIESHACHVTNTTSYLISCLVNAAANMDTSYDYSDC